MILIKEEYVKKNSKHWFQKKFAGWRRLTTTVTGWVRWNTSSSGPSLLSRIDSFSSHPRRAPSFTVDQNNNSRSTTSWLFSQPPADTAVDRETSKQTNFCQSHRLHVCLLLPASRRIRSQQAYTAVLACLQRIFSDVSSLSRPGLGAKRPLRPLPKETKPIKTRRHPEMVGNMSRVTLNFDLSKIPFVLF